MSLPILSLGLAALAGALVGAAYMALLWVAVRRLPQASGGAMLFVALTVARAALVLGVLAGALALGVQAGGLVAGLAGFVAVRVAATRGTRGPQGGPRWR